jgi:rubrerythrin
MTCKKCKITMQELKGHIFHGNRKWRCPQCQKVKMQKPRLKGAAPRDQ